VTKDYGQNGSTRFTGAVNGVEIDVDQAAKDADHFISPDERLRVPMAIQ
jgi:arylsulfatase